MAASAACAISLDGYSDGHAPSDDDSGDAGNTGDSQSTAHDATIDAAGNVLLSCQAPGLIAYFRFDEGDGGVAKNCVSSAFAATLGAGLSWGAGIEGPSALLADGNGQAMLANSGALLEDGVTTSFTITASVNAEMAAVNNLGRIYSKCPTLDLGGCANGLELLIERSNDGKTTNWALRVPGATQSDAVIVLGSPMTGRNIAIAGVYDETTVPPHARVFVDGELAGEATLPAVRHNAGGTTSIASKASGVDNAWSGTIDEVRVFTRALSACDVRMLAGKGCL